MNKLRISLILCLIALSQLSLAAQNPALNYFLTVDMQGYSQSYLFARARLWMDSTHFISSHQEFGGIRLESQGKFQIDKDIRGKIARGAVNFHLDVTVFEGAYKCVVTGMTFEGKFTESLEKEETEYASADVWKLTRTQADERARFMLDDLHNFIEDLPVFELEPVTIDDKKGVHLNAWKPVIYLYPEVETEVRVKLNFAGKLDFTYPPAANAWTVTAQPDGTLQTADGRKYSYLFWEGPFDENTWDISEGYCVGRVDVVSFLEEKLPWFGLNEREMEDFITFWAPKMQQNPFNWIHFSTQEYTDRANLCIEPEPDALIRVFMVYSPLEVAVKGTGQDLPKLERKGFTVVEWGGTELPLPEN